VYQGRLQILLKSRWHSLQEPEQDPEKWRRGFIESGKTDPLSDHPLRERLRTIWQSVSESLGFGRKRREREQRRKNNRRMAEHAIMRIWPSLGEEAKRRLAQHHATMIVCSDLEEVAQWDTHLKNVFGKNVQRSSLGGFVRWVETKDGRRLAIVVWNGPAKSVHEYYLYAHELAHIVDRDTSGDRISNSDEWQAAWESEKEEIVHSVYQPELKEAILRNPQEAFATLLALYWINPRIFRTQRQTIRRFLVERRLVHREGEKFPA